jgi:hypothetical protein
MKKGETARPQGMDELAYALKVEGGSPEHGKLLKAVRTFETSITYHRALVPNDGARFREGKSFPPATSLRLTRRSRLRSVLSPG